ncbi:MAG TPA: ATP-binding protein [Acidimicrobiia bacterium]
MTGASLHTKYRPTTLDEVVGQNHVKKGIQAFLDDGKQQSVIFEGPSGTGKTTLARICARALGIEEVIEIDAASNTGVDAMREISDRANYVSMGGGGKAFIVDECHRLSKQAWESLLKDIEEPPAGVYWFFCTTEGPKVLPTIRTRCQTFALQEVPYRALLGLLDRVAKAEGLNVSEDVLDLAADAAGGSPRQALVNLQTVAHAETPQEAAAALNRAGGPKEAIDLARLLAKEWSLSQAVAILKDMGDASPEGVRRVVFQYFLTIALGGNLNHLIVLDEFERRADDDNKMGDILLRLTRIKKRAQK